MPYTKTKAVREARRARAEEVQKRSAETPLKEKVKRAGERELEKLIAKHGEEEINKLKEQP